MRGCEFGVTIPGRTNLLEVLLSFKRDEIAFCQSLSLFFPRKLSRTKISLFFPFFFVPLCFLYISLRSQCVSPLFLFPFSHVYILPPKTSISLKRQILLFPLFFFPFSFFKSPNSKAIFPISNSPLKPSKESPTFLKLQW